MEDETLYEDFTELDVDGVMVDGGVSFGLALTYGVIEDEGDEDPLEDDVVVINGVLVLAEDAETLDVEKNEGKEDTVTVREDDTDKE